MSFPGQAGCRRGASPGGRRADPVVDDGIARERRGWDSRDLPCPCQRTTVLIDPAFDDRQVPVGGDTPDDGARQAPALADLGQPTTPKAAPISSKR